MTFCFRIRGFVPVTNGSGSWYFRQWPSSFFADYFLKLHLHHFSKIKSHKEVTKQQESRFFLLFLFDYRRIRILLPMDPDPGAQKLTDPADSAPEQDAQHWFPTCGTLLLVLYYVPFLSYARYLCSCSWLHLTYLWWIVPGYSRVCLWYCLLWMGCILVVSSSECHCKLGSRTEWFLRGGRWRSVESYPF